MPTSRVAGATWLLALVRAADAATNGDPPRAGPFDGLHRRAPLQNKSLQNLRILLQFAFHFIHNQNEQKPPLNFWIFAWKIKNRPTYGDFEIYVLDPQLHQIFKPIRKNFLHFFTPLLF